MRLCPDEKGVNERKTDKMTPFYRAIGLMSGTSLDGVDVALIETDGRSHVKPLGFLFMPYEAAFRERLRACFGKREGTTDPLVREVEDELTTLHAKAVAAFLKQEGLEPSALDLIGFHGQTIWHNPAERETIQLGDGALLAKLTGIDVVNDFRTADVKAGGQGAPLVPLYHRALAAALPKPTAIINIGGVSNITWIGGEGDDEILAFDLGTGNALIDDWMLRHAGQSCDRDGAMAAQGVPDEAHVAAFLAHPFFTQKPPKSLDRDVFADFVPTLNRHCEEARSADVAIQSAERLRGIRVLCAADAAQLDCFAPLAMTDDDNVSFAMTVEDGAATLTMMTVAAIAKGLEAVPAAPREIFIAGGGRHNATMMRWLANKTRLPIKSVDELGWNGDAIEAEAFAYLAVRSRLGLPLSVPNTTSVPAPMTGGTLHRDRFLKRMQESFFPARSKMGLLFLFLIRGIQSLYGRNSRIIRRG